MNWEQADAELLRCGAFTIERVMVDASTGWYELAHGAEQLAHLGLFHVSDLRGRRRMVDQLQGIAERHANG